MFRPLIRLNSCATIFVLPLANNKLCVNSRKPGKFSLIDIDSPISKFNLRAAGTGRKEGLSAPGMIPHYAQTDVDEAGECLHPPAEISPICYARFWETRDRIGGVVGNIRPRTKFFGSLIRD